MRGTRLPPVGRAPQLPHDPVGREPQDPDPEPPNPPLVGVAPPDSPPYEPPPETLLGWEAGASLEPEPEAPPEMPDGEDPTAPYEGLPEGVLYEAVADAAGDEADEPEGDSTTDSEVKDHPGMLMVPMVQVIPSSLVMDPSTSVPSARVSE